MTEYRSAICHFRVNAGNGHKLPAATAQETTLLRLLTGLARPDRGGLLALEQPLHHVRQLPSATAVDRTSAGDKTWLSALENLRFFHHDGDVAQCSQRWHRRGLAGYEDIPVNQPPPDNSGAALARLWPTRARLVDPDEPFTAIDVNGVERLTQRMAQHTSRAVLLFHHPPTASNVETDKGDVLVTSEGQRNDVANLPFGNCELAS